MNYRKCLDDAVSLVEDCESNLLLLKNIYDDSLKNKEIDRQLLVRVKNILENLRSALDFCANAMVLRYSNKKPRKIYFPYATLNITKKQFEIDKRIEKTLPDLKNSRPDLFKMIIDMQHFSHKGAKWFPEFMELNNKNKHVHLVPQGLMQGISLEVDGIKIVAPSLELNAGASIQTRFGNLIGPLKITPENVNKFEGYGIFKAEGWNGIFIEGYGFPMNAYEFNSHCVHAISSIVKQFSAAMP